MSSFQSAVALSLLVALSACAVPQPAEQLASADTAGAQSDVVCFYESPTGTNRKVRRCMSKEEYSKNVDAAQRYGNDIKMPPPLQR